MPQRSNVSRTGRSSDPARCAHARRHRLRCLTGIFLICFSLAAAGQQEQLPQLDGGMQAGSLKHRSIPSQTNVMAAPEDLTKARIAPGYLLQMDVFDTPEMNMELRVDPDGKIRVPLAGAVAVAGQTLLEAQARIEKALVDEQILKAPQVTLNVVQYASESATVLGEVQSPGRVPLLAPKPLGDVLAAAGGETFSAGPDVDLLHTDPGGSVRETHIRYTPEHGSQALQTIVFPGDTVTVRRAGTVYVLGGVNRPGAYLMVHDGSLNILEAIALAQGTILRASTNAIEVLRFTGESYARVSVPLRQIQKGQAAPPQLLANDIVYVPVSATKSVFLDGGALLGAAATASIYAIH